MADNDVRELKLGAKIRSLRELRGCEIDEVSKQTGISASQLQAYEADEDEPSIGELMTLGNALDASLGQFFQRELAESRVEVVRSGERWTVQPQSEAARALNYRYQSLSHRLTEKLMAPFLVEIPPGDVTDPTMSSHEGEEFIFVLAGRLQVRVGEETHVLDPGDSMYYDSRLEHSFCAIEGTAVRLLACVAQEHREAMESPLGRAGSD